MLTCGAWSCLQDGWTAMMHAADSGHVEVVDRLLAAGADKDAQDKVPGCARHRGVGVSLSLIHI